MTIPAFKRDTPGQPPDIFELNRLKETVEQLARMVTAGGLLFQRTAGGFLLTDARPRGFWAKINGVSGSAYSWTEQYQSSAGTFADYTPGRSSSTSQTPAYEISGATVPANAIVWLYPDPRGEHYLFAYSPSGTSDITYASGTDVTFGSGATLTTQSGSTATLNGSTIIGGTATLQTRPILEPAEVTLTASVNDYAGPLGPVWLVTSGGGSWSMTGIAGVADGAELTLVNVSPANTLTLVHQSASSLVANRFALPGNVNLLVAPGEAVKLQKDPVAARLRAVAVAQQAGGGGYTDEQAQDAVGGLLADTATIDATYDDAANRIEFSVKANSITNTHMGAGVLKWVKYTKTYSDLSATTTTNNVAIFSPAAKEIIHMVVIKTTENFTGGAITGYRLSVGFTAATNYDDYVQLYDAFVNESDTHDAVGIATETDVMGQLAYSALFPPIIYLRAEAQGALLSAATQGSADIWFLVSTLP